EVQSPGQVGLCGHAALPCADFCGRKVRVFQTVDLLEGGYMKRFKLTVAYDGTDYCGWQIQPNGVTVEEVLNRKLSELTGENITVIGASRTDSGVHALG